MRSSQASCSRCWVSSLLVRVALGVGCWALVLVFMVGSPVGLGIRFPVELRDGKEKRAPLSPGEGGRPPAPNSGGEGKELFLFLLGLDGARLLVSDGVRDGERAGYEIVGCVRMENH